MDEKEKWKIAQRGEKEIWKKILESGKTQSKKKWKEYLSKYHFLFPKIPLKSVVLDVGCGPDSLTNYLKVDGLKIGLDPLSDFYLSHYGPQKSVKYLKAVGEKIPLKKDSVDFVVSINSLDHTINPFMVLKEIRRVLKNNRCFLLDVSIEPFFDSSLYKLGYTPPLEKFHPHKFSSNLITFMLEKLGFEIKKTMFVEPINLKSLVKNLFSILPSRLKPKSNFPVRYYNILGNDILVLPWILIRIFDLIFYIFSKKYFAGRIIVLASASK